MNMSLAVLVNKSACKNSVDPNAISATNGQLSIERIEMIRIREVTAAVP